MTVRTWLAPVALTVEGRAASEQTWIISFPFVRSIIGPRAGPVKGGTRTNSFVVPANGSRECAPDDRLRRGPIRRGDRFERTPVNGFRAITQACGYGSQLKAG